MNTQNSSEEDEDDYTAVSVPVLIDKIRGIVKQLRTTNGSILLRRLKTKSSLDLSAVLDNDTRFVVDISDLYSPILSQGRKFSRF